jgi:amino acid permease
MAGEHSPLLVKPPLSSTASNATTSVSSITISNQQQQHHIRGNASVTQTVINLTKTCMGTGCLALPFAAQQSGIGFFIIGTFGVALWNVYAVQRLCHCWEVVQQRHVDGYEEEEDDDLDDHNQAQPSSSSSFSNHTKPVIVLPPEGTSILGQVTWYAFGNEGLFVMDILMIVLLFGIIVAYQDAILSFLSDTFVADWRLLNAFWSASLMATLSVVHDVGALTKGSAFGLCVLFASMSILTVYGISVNRAHDGDLERALSWTWLPQHGLTGISQWFGCVAFGFGTVPLTYNFQSSMAQPHRMVSATVYALVGYVATCYIILGVGLLYLYPQLEGDILHALPANFWLAQVTRWAMAVVILVTAPLLVVPCGQLIEGKLHPHHQHHNTWKTRYVVRFGVCYACAVISTLVPGFVNVLSLVGCASVALVSFCVPPLLHLAVLYKSHEGSALHRNVDRLMLACGILATSISTVYTLCKITAICYKA